MKKNKVLSIAIAGALTTAIVGSTLAYFISKDTVTNNFTTAKTGIKVEEVFDTTENAPRNSVKPGDEVNKDVFVTNIADYNQFIRVKITPVFTGENITGLDTNKIKLNFTNLTTSFTDTNKWVKDGEYYYYLGKVAPNAKTVQLLDSVTLDSTATDDKYQGKGYDVKVDAEGVQADHDAFTDWGITADSNLGKQLKALQ